MSAAEGDPSLSSAEAERLGRWLEALDDATHYELLGVLDVADDAAIRTAYHSLVTAFHPDVYQADEPRLTKAATRVFCRLHQAYRVLSNPQQRAAYDFELARRRQQEHPRPQAESGGSLCSLEELCRTAAAKLAARRADEMLSDGRLHESKRELQMALYLDGNDNPELAERLDALDLALFAMGA